MKKKHNYENLTANIYNQRNFLTDTFCIKYNLLRFLNKISQLSFISFNKFVCIQIPKVTIIFRILAKIMKVFTINALYTTFKLK